MRRLIVENAFTGERTEIDLDENLTFREALIGLVPVDSRDDFRVLDEKGNDISNQRVKDYKGAKVSITPPIVEGG